jgi:hypothetical protein
VDPLTHGFTGHRTVSYYLWLEVLIADLGTNLVDEVFLNLVSLVTEEVIHKLSWVLEKFVLH